jgi:hypothetical protein
VLLSVFLRKQRSKGFDLVALLASDAVLYCITSKYCQSVQCSVTVHSRIVKGKMETLRHLEHLPTKGK